MDHYVTTFWLDAYKHRVYLIRNIEEEVRPSAAANGSSCAAGCATSRTTPSPITAT